MPRQHQTDRLCLPAAHASRGLTLVEAVISLVIVAVMVSAALNLLGATGRAKQIHVRRPISQMLAQQLLSEIIQQSYRELVETPLFGVESPETFGLRAVYDDVDDYHGWSATPPQERDGTAIVNLDGWLREVTIIRVDPTDISQEMPAESSLKRITVTVTDPTGRINQTVGIRSDTDSFFKPPLVETTYVTWVGAELQIGQKAPPLRWGVGVANQSAPWKEKTP